MHHRLSWRASFRLRLVSLRTYEVVDYLHCVRHSKNFDRLATQIVADRGYRIGLFNGVLCDGAAPGGTAPDAVRASLDALRAWIDNALPPGARGA